MVGEINDILIDRQILDQEAFAHFTLSELELVLVEMGPRVKVAVLALLHLRKIKAAAGYHDGGDKAYEVVG